MSNIQKFKTTLLLAGKTATGFVIPDEAVEKLGAGKKPPVLVTLNGYTYQNTIAVMGGKFMVGVSAEHREKSKVKAGDLLEIQLELDTQIREVEVPSELLVALQKNKLAKKNFESLSNSKKTGLIAPVVKAKTEETKQRNIKKIIDSLSL